MIRTPVSWHHGCALLQRLGHPGLLSTGKLGAAQCFCAPEPRDAPAAIDGYLDLFGEPNAATARSSLPFGNPCERVEGSRFINCTDGMPVGGPKAGKENSMRRFVIDDVVGSDNVLCSFTAVGNIPDSHELRIVNGKIRHVHTITLCAIDDGPDWGPTCKAARAGKSTR
ncbi:hypothetical protein QBC43DRAFT_289200 [Cladorrhinum sp. PSN259]|nr:hypothetical protein QBC43DRAFT_289200 [Cladorrhinum sp. PSN259]